jgi:hypothetical protein
MRVSLPREIVLPTIFNNASNKIYIDGKLFSVGGNALIIYRIICRHNAIFDQEGPDLVAEVSGSAEKWIKFAVSNDPILLGRTIGRFCDYVLLTEGDGQIIEDRGWIKAAFALPVSLPASECKVVSFLYSCISKGAFNGESPSELEDYIWLAEHYTAPDEVPVEHVEAWLKDLNAQYSRPNLLLTPKGVRRINDMYIAAVLERLSMYYRIFDVISIIPLIIAGEDDVSIAYTAARKWQFSVLNQ